MVTAKEQVTASPFTSLLSLTLIKSILSVLPQVFLHPVDETNNIKTAPSAEGYDFQRKDILSMALSWIRCWGSTSGALGSAWDPFVASIPRSTLTWSNNTSQDPINESDRYFCDLLVFNGNTWIHITVSKLFVLRIVTWSCNCWQSITRIISCLNYIFARDY